MTGGGIQPCGDGGRFVSISMRAERHRLTGAERTDFVLSALFFVERCRKNRKKFCFRFDKWGKCDILSLMRLKNGDDLSSCTVALRTFFSGPKQAFLISFPESPPKAENSGVRKKSKKRKNSA